MHVSDTLVPGPALVTTALLTLQSTANDSLMPLIYLDNKLLLAITLGPLFSRSTYTVQWAYLMAAYLATLLPMMIIFFVAPKAFCRGITPSGVKGQGPWAAKGHESLSVAEYDAPGIMQGSEC